MGSRSPDRNGLPGRRALTIGAVARCSGFSIKALRFYERGGLLPAAGRTPGGFRLYTEADLHRLEFIRQAKALGVSLDQIRELLVTARERTCSMTRPLILRILEERIRQTAQQMEALGRLKAELERRRRALSRRRPTNHGRGYCACFEEEEKVIPGLLPVPNRAGLGAGPRPRERRSDGLRGRGRLAGISSFPPG